MAKTRKQKESELSVLEHGMNNAGGIVFASFHDLKMKDMDELRTACKAQNVEYIVAKKTIMKRALESAGKQDVDVAAFEGGVSVLFGYGEDLAPAQIIAKFAKGRDMVRIFGGFLNGVGIDGAKVTALSKLPTRQQLLGQLVGTLNAPISGFVNVLAGNLRGLVNVLNAVKEAKV
ncbi:MAG: 50S ribosomal protein L10 [Patescibacteria group bacterium]